MLLMRMWRLQAPDTPGSLLHVHLYSDVCQNEAGNLLSLRVMRRKPSRPLLLHDEQHVVFPAMHDGSMIGLGLQ